jgi:hypothetical protein
MREAVASPTAAAPSSSQIFDPPDGLTSLGASLSGRPVQSKRIVDPKTAPSWPNGLVYTP